MHYRHGHKGGGGDRCRAAASLFASYPEVIFVVHSFVTEGCLWTDEPIFFLHFVPIASCAQVQ